MSTNLPDTSDQFTPETTGADAKKEEREKKQAATYGYDGKQRIIGTPKEAVDGNGNPNRNSDGSNADFFVGLMNRQDGMHFSPEELSRRPEKVEVGPAGVGLLQLLRYLLGFIASFRNGGEPYREENMTLSERFQKRLVDKPYGFPVALTRSELETLNDQGVIDICLDEKRLGEDGSDEGGPKEKNKNAPVIRLFAKDIKDTLKGVTYFSNIDVNGQNYNFTSICADIEKLGITTDAKPLLLTQSYDLFVRNRKAIPNKDEAAGNADAYKKVKKTEIKRLVGKAAAQYLKKDKNCPNKERIRLSKEGIKKVLADVTKIWETDISKPIPRAMIEKKVADVRLYEANKRYIVEKIAELTSDGYSTDDIKEMTAEAVKKHAKDAQLPSDDALKTVISKYKANDVPVQKMPTGNNMNASKDPANTVEKVLTSVFAAGESGSGDNTLPKTQSFNPQDV